MSQPVDRPAPHAAAGGSVIHDIGYQRYTGPRLGAGYAWSSLYVHSLRSVFGLGRTSRAKIFPWAIVIICVGMAVLFTWLRAILPIEDLVELPSYLDFPGWVSAMVLLFLAVASPELVSRDMRNRVLPLYFSRPLSRTAYPTAKLAALVTALFFMLGAPQLVMFLGAALSDNPVIPPVSEELTEFLPGLGYAAIYSLVLACLGVFIASLASRRGLASGAIVAVFLVTLAFMGVLTAVGESVAGASPLRYLAGVVSPFTLLEGLKKAVFGEGLNVGQYGGVYYVVTIGLIAVTAGLTLLRYRKVAI